MIKWRGFDAESENTWEYLDYLLSEYTQEIIHSLIEDFTKSMQAESKTSEDEFSDDQFPENMYDNDILDTDLEDMDDQNSSTSDEEIPIPQIHETRTPSPNIFEADEPMYEKLNETEPTDELDEPIDETADEPIDETEEDKPTEEPMDEPADELIDETADEPMDETIEEIVDLDDDPVIRMEEDELSETEEQHSKEVAESMEIETREHVSQNFTEILNNEGHVEMIELTDCIVCLKNEDYSESVQCTNCKSKFHTQCIPNFETNSYDKDTWQCLLCVIIFHYKLKKN